MHKCVWKIKIEFCVSNLHVLGHFKLILKIIRQNIYQVSRIVGVVMYVKSLSCKYFVRIDF